MLGKTLSLVILDDDPSICRLCQLWIKRNFQGEFNVQVFSSPVEAMRWLEDHGCDLLVSDIDMPEINGMEVLQFAKRRNGWTQVIFFTGHIDAEWVTTALEKGICDYMVKPLVEADFSAILKVHYDRIMRWRKALQLSLTRSSSRCSAQGEVKNSSAITSATV